MSGDQFDYLFVVLGIFLGTGVGAVTLGRVIHAQQDQIFSLQIENEKLLQQRDMWHRTANLPDAEEHRPVLTPEELERRNDLIDDVIDERNL